MARIIGRKQSNEGANSQLNCHFRIVSEGCHFAAQGQGANRVRRGEEVRRGATQFRRKSDFQGERL